MPSRLIETSAPAIGRPVTVAKAVQEDMEEWLTVPGTVMPLRIVTVRSRIDGELMRVNFKEGQPVKAGDVLAEIDPQIYVAAVEGARANLVTREADVARDQFRIDFIPQLHHIGPLFGRVGLGDAGRFINAGHRHMVLKLHFAFVHATFNRRCA